MLRVETGVPAAIAGARIDNGAGVGCCAIDTVGACGKQGATRSTPIPLDFERRTQRQVLVAATPSGLRRQGDGRFSTLYEHVPGGHACKPRDDRLAQRACITLETSTIVQHAVARVACSLGCRFAPSARSG